ncbi:ricin B lectin (PTP6g) [Vairimorpha necatrix]|uniref:Ricin B lectin (PTP6g) n=1 Tax=Vairimorpha necatrix TaxID=6039 RepID=A0AAX4JF17_9MICR
MSDGTAHSVDKSNVNTDDDFFLSGSRKASKQNIWSTKNKKVLSIGDGSKLKYKDSKPNKESQLIGLSLIGPKTFIFRNRDKCVEYDKNSDKYYSKKCSSSDNQKFLLVKDKDESI